MSSLRRRVLVRRPCGPGLLRETRYGTIAFALLMQELGRHRAEIFFSAYETTTA